MKGPLIVAFCVNVEIMERISIGIASVRLRVVNANLESKLHACFQKVIHSVYCVVLILGNIKFS